MTGIASMINIIRYRKAVWRVAKSSIKKGKTAPQAINLAIKDFLKGSSQDMADQILTLYPGILSGRAHSSSGINEEEKLFAWSADIKK